MQGDIEADNFVLVPDAQRDECVDHLEDEERYAARPDPGDDNTVELGDDLLGITLEQAMNAAGQFRAGGKCADRKNTGEQSAGESADAMHTEDIERVVIADFELEPGAGPKADPT